LELLQRLSTTIVNKTAVILVLYFQQSAYFCSHFMQCPYFACTFRNFRATTDGWTRSKHQI